MVDQVSPTGSLAAGLPQALAVAAKPQPAPEQARPAKIAASSPPTAEGARPADSAENTEDAAKQVNAYLQQSESDLKMKVDKGTGRTVFQVVRSNTGEVLLQVPSEEVLAMARKLSEMAKQKGASGVLMDKEG